MHKNPLSELVHHTLVNKASLLSNLASKIGYSDINRGIKELNEVLTTLDDIHNLLPLIQQELDINPTTFELAVTMSKKMQQTSKPTEFFPHITVHLKNNTNLDSKEHSKIQIDFPASIINMPISHQIGCAYRLFREYIATGNIDSTGFSYHRTLDEEYKLQIYT